MHSRGFPNLFIMNGPQGGGGQFNFTRVSEMHANYVVWALEEMKARGARSINVTQEAEDEYTRHCAEMDLLPVLTPFISRSHGVPVSTHDLPRRVRPVNL